jgi:deoxyribodipyrimidine photolyase-related protein
MQKSNHQPYPSEILVIFPNQLYAGHPWFVKERKMVLVEESLFFTQYRFHKKKLMLHRASMKAWQADKIKQGFTVDYIEAIHAIHDIRTFIEDAAHKGLKKIVAFHPSDDWLQRRIQYSCKKNSVELQWIENPNFLNTPEDGDVYFANKKHYHQTDFYILQRKARKLLLDADRKPLGGQWTFDAENREKFPKTERVPVLKIPAENKWLKEAAEYVNQHFPGNYGETDAFIFPVNRNDSLQWLDEFLEKRFEKFGVYEDAMVAKENYLYHSVLTPMLNIGLLQPGEIVNAALNKASEKEIPLNSLEGFIRQIVGWREFIRLVYEREGRKQRTTNYWGFTRKIPPKFWTGETGIEPVDIVVKKLLQASYNHHIERLMVMGNFFLLCEFDPDEVYRWFMEMYIDAYDWVMVPNVYGMTQFSDGGLMTTKPYISGSNYLMKMGDWPKGDWQAIWDGLFWRFMHVHRDFFLKNPRLGMLVKTFDKMKDEKRELHIRNAAGFLEQLDRWNGR